MKNLFKRNILLLFILSLSILGCTNKNERHLGLWKRIGEMESLLIEFKELNEVELIGLNSNKSETDIYKYEIDYSKDPIWLDFIHLDKKTNEESDRVLWIIRFPSKNKMEIRSSASNIRHKEFDSNDIDYNSFLERTVKGKEVEKTIITHEITKTKKFPYYKTDLEEMKLRGNVKSYREFSYKTIDNFGEISKGEKQYEDGFDYVTYRVPKGGYLTFNKRGFFNETIKYDKFGEVIKKVVLSYKENGIKIEEKEFKSKGVFVGKLVFKYNDNGFLIDRTMYDENGNMSYKFVFDNNEDRNDIEERLYVSERELKELTRYKYDENGKLVMSEKRYYNSPLISIRNFFTYDDKGNLILNKGESTIEEGTVETEYNYSYNDKGDKTEHWFGSSSSSYNKTTYEYEYDSNDNWISRIEYVDGFSKFILEREIEYY